MSDSASNQKDKTKSEKETYLEYLEDIDAQRQSEGIGKTYVQVEVEAHRP